MPLKITRVRAGVYRTEIHGKEVYLSGGNGSDWQAVHLDDTMRVLAAGRTKKELVSRLEALARTPGDREVSDTLKLFRRSQIEKGTTLTVAGIKKSTTRNPDGKARCTFLSYTRKSDGSEWIDVLAPGGFSRTVRPERIKTVHRRKNLR